MTNLSIFEKQILVDSSVQTALELLADRTALSKQKIKQAMAKGAVWLTPINPKKGKTQRLRRVTRQLSPGDKLHIYYNEHILVTKPTPPTLITDEGKYSVWFKPPGVLSQGSLYGDHCAISRWVELNLKPTRPCFVVHRLDRAAAGLIILAHNNHAAGLLSTLFQTRQINKQYRVLCEGDLHASEKSITCEAPIDGKQAISHFKSLKFVEALNATLLDVDIETGRKHQIRRHLALLGHPVVGDDEYGTAHPKNQLQLAATRLEFISPFDKKPRSYTLPNAYLSDELTDAGE